MTAPKRWTRGQDRAELGELWTRQRLDLRIVMNALMFGHRSFEPLGVQLAVELYRWMMTTADKHEVQRKVHRGGRWPNTSLLHALGRPPGELAGTNEIAPFRADWRARLRLRLLHALQDEGIVAAWRREVGLVVDGRLTLRALFYPQPLSPAREFWKSGEECVADAVDALFALRGRLITRHLNPVHQVPMTVVHVDLTPRPEGWSAEMTYGFDGSIWYEDHSRPWRENGLGRAGIDPLRAAQRPDEAFYDFVQRARRHLERITQEPVGCTGGEPRCTSTASRLTARTHQKGIE